MKSVPLTANGLDPFSNDAPGRSPRYPSAMSGRIASFGADPTRKTPRAALRSYRKIESCECDVAREKERGRDGARGRGELIRNLGARCGQSFRRYDETPSSWWFSMKYHQSNPAAPLPNPCSVGSFKSPQAISKPSSRRRHRVFTGTSLAFSPFHCIFR